MRDFHCSSKHKILPSPPERGRGVGGEGAIRFHGRARLPQSPPLESSTVLRLSRSFALPLWPTTRNNADFAGDF
jgi:hypothetical protein